MSATIETHIKHAYLTKPVQGNFGRNELAILGTTCDNISRLVQTIIAGLPQYTFGFADADHKEKKEGTAELPAVSFTATAVGTQLFYKASFNNIQQRALFTNTDLVLVNGNHFTAARQIVVIDDAKPLHKKIARLTNVCLVLLQEGITSLPAYLLEQVSDIQNVPILSIKNEDAIIDFIYNFIQKSTPVINGLVLAGGESRRMGCDKGSLAYHGISQRQHSYNMLQQYSDDVYVSCNATQKETVNAEGLPFIEDSFIGLGPVGGILSAFRHNPNAAWLTVACDLPYLSHETLARLVAGRNASKMATAFSNNDDNGWPEPLVTIWEPRSYPWLLQLLAQGYSCPRKALMNADIALLETANMQELHNVNEHSDYLTTLHNLQAT